MKINIAGVLPLFLVIFFAITTRASDEAPVLYKIRVTTTDLTGYDMEIRISDRKGLLRLAMAAHPEYDDRYWRYIENVSAEDTKGGRLQVIKESEDPVWRIENVSGDVIVHYRLNLPKQERPVRDSWKPFLTPTGGMVGDLHSLMYVVGEESRPARLTLDIPGDWDAASGLEATSDPHVYTGSTELMLDSPVVVGRFSETQFQAGGVPHHVVLWSEHENPTMDAKAMVDGVRRICEEAIKAFGKPPYRRYFFLFQNGGQAGLEHLTSGNVGISTRPDDLFQQTAHEYIHAWNLMDVRPRERVGVKYRFAEPTGVLWWNEGATLMFTDLILRRAGLTGERGTRVKHLESALSRYLSSPGYAALSAEIVSRGDSHPILLGDYGASTHLQGEVLATMLDLRIRDTTAGRRDVTDAMKVLAERFDSQRGIANSDIETVLNDVCRCDFSNFFKSYIYGAKLVDFNTYLNLMGLGADVVWTTAVDEAGKPVVDLRISPLSTEGDLKLRVTNPQNAWGKAGLHTGDRLLSADGRAVSGWSDFRDWLRKLKVGDTGRLVIERAGVQKTVKVDLKPFDVPTVRIDEIENATPKQLRLREAWVNSK